MANILGDHSQQPPACCPCLHQLLPVSTWQRLQATRTAPGGSRAARWQHVKPALCHQALQTPSKWFDPTLMRSGRRANACEQVSCLREGVQRGSCLCRCQERLAIGQAAALAHGSRQVKLLQGRSAQLSARPRKRGAVQAPTGSTGCGCQCCASAAGAPTCRAAS